MTTGIRFAVACQTKFAFSSSRVSSHTGKTEDSAQGKATKGGGEGIFLFAEVHRGSRNKDICGGGGG